MKLKEFILFTLCLTALCGFPNSLFAQQDESPRISLNFNREWKYARGDFKGAEAMNFDDLAWETVGLPHSFSIPYFMSKDFYVGYGWYRKSLNLKAKELSKKIFLEFDGVFQEAEIFVNNQLVGKHEGGYTGFSVDISSAVKRGNNLIAVRVNNEWKSNRAPRAGEHVFSGGIYRNVRLVMKAPTFI
ncbi:MAG: beta-galactosidase, partial [Bacteroides sp.]